MRTRSRRLAAAAVAVLAGLLMAGCSALPGIGGTDPLSAVLAASDKTSEAGSSRFAMTTTTTVAGEPLEFSGEGVFDYTGQRGTITMNIPDVGQTTTIIDGTVIYQQIPAAQAATLGGNWFRIDAGGLIGNDQASGSSDPSQFMNWLKGASDDITEVGQEDLRGDSTTHYRVTIDLQRAAEQSGEDPASIQQMQQALGTTTLPADIWIDGEGRLRKMSFNVQATAEGQPATNSTSFELWDFGVAVDVTPPPENEIVELSDAIQGAVDGAAEESLEGLDESLQDLDQATQELDDLTGEVQEGVDPADVAEFERQLDEWLNSLSEAEKEQMRQQFGEDLAQIFEEQFAGEGG